MGGGTGVAQGKLIKLPDGTRATFGGLEISAIADGLQGADALGVEFFIAEGLVITGAVADAEAAIAGETGEFGEPFWVLNIGDEEMGPDEPDAGGGAEALDLGELAAGLAHEAAELGLTVEGLVQQFVEEQGLGTQGVVRQLPQPSHPAGFGEDGGAGGEEAPMLEEGFELEFEAGLPLDGVLVAFGDAFEEDALILGGLPDGFEFVEAQETGQGEGVAAVVLVGIVADEAIATGITDDDLLEVGFEQLADPAGEIGFFEHESFVGGGDGLDMLDEFLGLGGELPPLEFGAVIVEVAEDTVFGVGIQTEPCYRCAVIHNKPLVVVNVVNNLADAWRIRICSFTESLYCSVHQVVRFSIYQEPPPITVSVPPSRLTDWAARLSFCR